MTKKSVKLDAPTIHCTNRCGTNQAVWVTTWYENDKGKTACSEHIACPNCGTSTVKVVKNVEQPKPATSLRAGPSPEEVLDLIQLELLEEQ